MTKKRQALKIAAVITALLLLAGVVSLTNLFTGYPVDYFVVNHAVQNYMEETYGETDFVAGKPERALKLGGFLVEVTSLSRPEVRFTLHFYVDGTLWEDGYQQMMQDVTAAEDTVSNDGHG